LLAFKSKQTLAYTLPKLVVSIKHWEAEVYWSVFDRLLLCTDR